MPQIAQQDYNVVKPAYADYIHNDAAALGVLAGHIERGTIFDVLVKIAKDGDSFSRVVAASKEYGNIMVVDPEDGTLTFCPNGYTPTQYEGLAAVQVACELTENLPSLAVNDYNYLMEDNSSYYLCADGKIVIVTLDDEDKIAALQVSSESPSDESDWVNVSFEELQKLIGLPTV